MNLRRPRSLQITDILFTFIDKSENVLNFKHSYQQTATKPARYYGIYRIGEQPWMFQRST